MKKAVLKFGLISGGISAALMIILAFSMDKIGFDIGESAGYAFIILSFVPIYFGMMHYRNNAPARPGFLQYLGTGLLIAVISSLFYAFTWTILYYTVFPDFMEKYTAHMMEHMKQAGKSAEEMKKTLSQIQQYKDMYKTPVSVFAWTFLLEPLPVGILVSLVSALVTKLKK